MHRWNAPVADTIGFFLHWVPTINTTVINVGNPAASLRSVASWPSTYNYNRCDVRINCASPLTGDHYQAFMYRAGMTRFPFGSSVSGNMLSLNLFGSNTNGMFVNCLALRLSTTDATRNVNISIPNSTDARQMFTRDYLWGDPNAHHPLNVNIQVPNALDIFNLVWLEKRPAGHIDYLTINAPKATSANYCVGSLYAINGYNINIPVAVPVPVPIYNADNIPVDPTNITGPIDERILSRLDTYGGDIHIYNCPDFHPIWINRMLNASSIHIHGGYIANDGKGVVSRPSHPIQIHMYGFNFTKTRVAVDDFNKSNGTVIDDESFSNFLCNVYNANQVSDSYWWLWDKTKPRRIRSLVNQFWSGIGASNRPCYSYPMVGNMWWGHKGEEYNVYINGINSFVRATEDIFPLYEHL